MPLEYTTCGIDVHKNMLAAVIGSPDIDEKDWISRKFGTSVAEINHLVSWLQKHGVRVVVMESTASYWRTVWIGLEPHFKPLLAQAQSNKGPHGRKTDFGDARRLIRRLHAGELRLSYVPEAAQREQRSLCHAIVQHNRQRTQLRNQIETLLEESRIKLAVSDWLGVSGRLILKALVGGKHTAEEMAELVRGQLVHRKEEVAAGLQGGSMSATCRLMLGQKLDLIELIDRQQKELVTQLYRLQEGHLAVIQRLSKVPGIDVLGAQRIVAAIGPEASAFETAGHLASWVGLCPGRNQSADRSMGSHSPQGYRPLRELLVQQAWSAARTKGSFFESLYQRLLPSKKAAGAIWAVAHRLIRLVWMILHEGVEYREMGPRVAADSVARKLKRVSRFLKTLGLTIAPNSPIEGTA